MGNSDRTQRLDGLSPSSVIYYQGYRDDNANGKKTALFDTPCIVLSSQLRRVSIVTHIHMHKVYGANRISRRISRSVFVRIFYVYFYSMLLEESVAPQIDVRIFSAPCGDLFVRVYICTRRK